MAVTDGPPTDVLAALVERTRGLAPGQALALADLEAADPYGPQAFGALARRFGLVSEASEQWRRGKLPRWTPGWVGPRDEAACLRLFQAAFGHPMAAALWRWKYRHNDPAGMGVWRADELVAFYGGMSRSIRYFGAPQLAVQIGDVMVHPDERGVMTRSGPFQIAASTFLERSIGHGRPHLVGFGFPTAKALQVAQKLDLYEQVDRMLELSWPTQRTLAARLDRCEAADHRDSLVVDHLWQAMAGHFESSVLGVRDWNFIRERYLEHPLNAYQCLLVRQRFGGRPKGLLVVRNRASAGLEILDLVGAPPDFADLIRAARHWGAGLGLPRTVLWVTTSHARLFEGSGARQAPMDLSVPANVWSPGPTTIELAGKWWLTAGDTDFR